MTPAGAPVIDLTPLAAGPWCVPAVNLDDHLDAVRKTCLSTSP
jgi:acetaldehyde dehydrogenase